MSEFSFAGTTFSKQIRGPNVVFGVYNHHLPYKPTAPCNAAAIATEQ